MFWSRFIYESLKNIGFKKSCCTLQHNLFILKIYIKLCFTKCFTCRNLITFI